MLWTRKKATAPDTQKWNMKRDDIKTNSCGRFACENRACGFISSMNMKRSDVCRIGSRGYNQSWIPTNTNFANYLHFGSSSLLTPHILILLVPLIHYSSYRFISRDWVFRGLVIGPLEICLVQYIWWHPLGNFRNIERPQDPEFMLRRSSGISLGPIKTDSRKKISQDAVVQPVEMCVDRSAALVVGLRAGIASIAANCA